MVGISKAEAKVLKEQYGVGFGYEGISRSHSKNGKYYLCESKYNLNKLKEIREGK